MLCSALPCIPTRKRCSRRRVLSCRAPLSRRSSTRLPTQARLQGAKAAVLPVAVHWPCRSAARLLPSSPIRPQGTRLRAICIASKEVLSMVHLSAFPLIASAFSPFGDVLEAPDRPGRAIFANALASRRGEAKPTLSLVHRPPTELPVQSSTMERHRWSSQTFLPLNAGRWLIVVAPHMPSGDKPDMANARAFVARGTQGVTYGADVWHHPFTGLDRPARFAVSMWRHGDAEDGECGRADE